MRFRNAILFLIFTLGNAAWAQQMSTKEYIETFKFAAMEEMKVYKIPASITLAQGILESSSGNSKLCKDCNNHFGIKCRKNWTGSHCLADDDAPNECFRGYNNAMESYRDHSLFLLQNSRYAKLFTLQITDYVAWANGLKEAGYATNPAYASIITGVIERYRLTRFDSMVLLGDDYVFIDSNAQKIIENLGIPAVVAKSGQTQASIATDNNMGTWQVRKYNDLKRGEPINPGEIVYLKPKNRKGDVPQHTVKEGETLREISQKHAIKLKHLRKKNHIPKDAEVKPGQVLELQKKGENTPELINISTPIKDQNINPNTVKNNKTEEPKKDKLKVDKPISTDNIYEVRAGETLIEIANKIGISVADLKRWNNLNSDEIKEGQILVLKRGIAIENKPANDTAATESEIESGTEYHIVVKGETLFSIARQYNVSVDFLKRINHLTTNNLSVGQELLIREKTSHDTKETPTVAESKYHVVAKGETLYSIAKKYKTSVSKIKELNKLTTDTISLGLKLRVL